MDSVRKVNLERLLAGRPYRGDRKALYEAAGLTKGRLAQLLDPKHSFGERAARSLVEKLGLPEGYFERKATTDDAQVQPSATSFGEAVIAVAETVAGARRTARMQLAPLMQALAQEPEQRYDIVAAIVDLLDQPAIEYTQSWEQTARETAALDAWSKADAATIAKFLGHVDEAHSRHTKVHAVREGRPGRKAA